MVEQLAQDYANYFRQADISKEVSFCELCHPFSTSAIIFPWFFLAESYLLKYR